MGSYFIVVGYTYDSDIHCDSCATDRFGMDENGYVPQDAVDREDNQPHPIFRHDESALCSCKDSETGQGLTVCGSCHAIIFEC